MKNKKPRSLDVYEAIKKKILLLEYPPKFSLTETTLSNEFGVSRTPIREALKLLEKDNLIEFIPNKGAFVKNITLNEINELFMIREIIESHCAGLAATLISNESIHVLEAKLDEAIKNYKQNNFIKSSNLGSEIHKIIIGVCGNKKLEQLLLTIEEELSRIQHMTSDSPQKIEKSINQHKEIVDAINLHDSKLAEQKMKDHIKSVKDDVIFEFVTKTLSSNK